MDTNDLKSYLNNVRVLEETCYTCRESMGKLKCRASKLGINECIKKPVKKYFGITLDWNIGEILGGSYILGIIISLIIFGIMWPEAFGALWVIGCIQAGIFSAGVGLLIALTITLLVYVGNFIYSLYYFSHLYKKEYKKYLLKIKNNEIRTEKELQIKKNLMSQYYVLQDTLCKTEKLLEKLYSYNIIYYKYRNLVAVTMFYEYIDSGKCTQLEGHEGAYNKFDQDVLAGIIITELRNISQQLETIKQVQYMLYEEMKKGNSIANKILASAEQMERDAEVVRYNSYVESQNSSIILQEIKMHNIWETWSHK